MRVTLLLPQVLRPSAGGKSKVDVEMVDEATLGSVLDALAREHPALERRLRDEQRELRRYVNFFVDGEEVRRLDGVGTRLPDGAEVQVLPSVAGG